VSEPKAPVQGDLWNRRTLEAFVGQDSPLAAERAYVRGLEAIRDARRMGLPPRLRLRQALERARTELMKCSEERADAVRALLRSHALQRGGFNR
jgi:hypothetical protein